MYENLVKLYCNKKQLLIFIMGISSGIPLYLILSTLFIWLARENVDISTIGLFALTQIPWSLKFLWAPFIDNYKIPFLCNFFWTKKILAFINPTKSVNFYYLFRIQQSNRQLRNYCNFCFIGLIFSASQDIVVDAYKLKF